MPLTRDFIFPIRVISSSCSVDSDYVGKGYRECHRSNRAVASSEKKFHCAACERMIFDEIGFRVHTGSQDYF